MSAEHEPLLLLAPLAGWCTPLDDLPDQVFASRMLGDGVAIDPLESVLQAPCDGEVIALPASRHAITLRAANGAEILLHVGIDTVALQGHGFEACVQVGDRVSAGAPLLRFDLDALARRAPSLLTPIVVLSAGYTVSALATGKPLRSGEPMLRITASARDAQGAVKSQVAERVIVDCHDASTAAERPPVQFEAIVQLEHGLHARPAARVVEAARTALDAAPTLSFEGRVADARSVTALMTLGVRHGDRLSISARGADGAAVAMRISAVLAGEGDDAVPAPDRAAGSSPIAINHAATMRPGVISGVIASRGLAVGSAHHLRAVAFEVPERGLDLAHETAALERARQSVRLRLANAAAGLEPARAGIAAAHLALLDDPVLVATAGRALAQGKSAAHGWRTAINEQAAALEQLDDAYLRERVADLRDLEAQVLAALGLQPLDPVEALPERAIVLAHEILPSQFAALDPARLAGLCMAGGGPTSHVAIMASAVGLPMLVAAGNAIDAVPEGREVILDATAGVLQVAPDAQALAAANQACAQDRAHREAQRIAAARPGATRDGRRIHVFANLGSPDEASTAVGLGAEGCGLLRTEFLFLGRRTPPSEDEQLEVYQQIARHLDGRPLTVRTLDAGGDKPIDYLPMPTEENPALGLRGVRTSLWRPELLRTQLRAILRVQPRGQCRILLPMITDVSDIDAVRTELAAARASLGSDAATLALGVMIETPAAAMLADTLAPHVDFFSVGTNDLTQYTLAMDRGHPELASRLDGLHPAVLRLIDTAARAARSYSREFAVCGNLAIDVHALPILVGLGVEELSVASAAVPAVKARLAELDFESCLALAARALDCATALQVRALVMSP